MIINGKEYDFENITVTQMLEKFEFNKEMVVVEVNMEIIPKEQYDDRILDKEAKVEIVAFVGGG